MDQGHTSTLNFCVAHPGNPVHLQSGKHVVILVV